MASPGRIVPCEQFNRLTAVSLARIDRSGHYWTFKCDCGNERVIRAARVSSGHTKSCGCLGRPSAIFAGHRYGRLTAIKQIGADGQRKWLFKCDCSNEHTAPAGPVKFGQIKSCGCLFRDYVVKPRPGKHKMIHSPEYKVWTAMRRRCSKADQNPRHGGRGITVCDRWQAFADFYADMGPRPSSRHSIDRIDNNGNYEPGNCRWATPKEQAINRNNTIYVKVHGREMLLADAAVALAINYRTLYWRLKHGRPTDGLQPITA